MSSRARPTVEEVALLIRARTKDRGGHEVGTFDEDTRPTANQVEEQIDVAAALIATRLPPIDELPDQLQRAVAAVVAYRAALRVEKSYWPEQIETRRSAYNELWQEYESELEALVAAATSAGGEPYGRQRIGQIPVGSWTLAADPCCPPSSS